MCMAVIVTFSALHRSTDFHKFGTKFFKLTTVGDDVVADAINCSLRVTVVLGRDLCLSGDRCLVDVKLLLR